MTTWRKELTELEKKFDLTDSQCQKQIAKLRNFITDITVVVGCITEKSDAQKAKESVVFSDSWNLFST